MKHSTSSTTERNGTYCICCSGSSVCRLLKKHFSVERRQTMLRPDGGQEEEDKKSRAHKEETPKQSAG